MEHIDHDRDSRVPYTVFMCRRDLSKAMVKLKYTEAAKEEVIPITQMVE